MGRIRRRPTGARSHLTTITCEWCGEPHECTRHDTRTCSHRCRQRLSRLFRLTGFAPDEPPGDRGVQAVYLELVQVLLLGERRRREERAAYIAAGRLVADRG